MTLKVKEVASPTDLGFESRTSSSMLYKRSVAFWFEAAGTVP